MNRIAQQNSRSVHRWCACIATLLLAAGLTPGTVSAQSVFTVYELPTRDGHSYYVIDTDETSGTALRGLAVDDAGRLYVSDQGNPNERNGVLYMLRGTNEAVRLHERLAAPGDIELTPDQRGLVVAKQGGGVEVCYFGVAVRLVGGDEAQLVNARAVLISDWGPVVGERRSDGFLHFPEVLRPGQDRLEATLVIENVDPPQAHVISLANPETGTIAGQVVVDVELSE